MASVHRRLYLWDLRAARAGLREVGLDWSDAPLAEPPPRFPCASSSIGDERSTERDGARSYQASSSASVALKGAAHSRG